MQVRYTGPKKGSFHIRGKVSGQSYTFSAGSLQVQEVDDRDAVALLAKSDFKRAQLAQPEQRPFTPTPTPAAAPTWAAAQAPEPVVLPPQPAVLPPSERPKPTAVDLKAFEVAAVPDETDWPMDDFAALLGVKPEVSDALQSAGLFRLADVAGATDEELLAVKGVGRATLRDLRQALKDAAG